MRTRFAASIGCSRCVHVRMSRSRRARCRATATTRFRIARLHPYIRRVYDAFGPQRMFWGTDLTRLPCTYREGIAMFTEHLPWLSAADKEWIMGRGVCEWIGWKL
jgi:predicted TIM-barrel fold metal-dependent hydrolase